MRGITGCFDGLSIRYLSNGVVFDEGILSLRTPYFSTVLTVSYTT